MFIRVCADDPSWNVANNENPAKIALAGHKFSVDFCMSLCHDLKMSPKRLSELWIQGYRDGWKGGKPPLVAPQEWVSGWTEGNRDRRHGWAQPRYAHLCPFGKCTYFGRRASGMLEGAFRRS